MAEKAAAAAALLLICYPEGKLQFVSREDTQSEPWQNQTVCSEPGEATGGRLSFREAKWVQSHLKVR